MEFRISPQGEQLVTTLIVTKVVQSFGPLAPGLVKTVEQLSSLPERNKQPFRQLCMT